MMLNFPIDAVSVEAGKADETPEDADGSVRTRFTEHLAWLKDFLASRFQHLQQRIRDERQRFDEFDDSAPAAISRAFQQDLRNASALHIDLLVRLLGLSEEIGEDDEAMRAQLEGTLTVAAESVSGQILLDVTTLKELRSMLRADPGNTELARAERAVERKQMQNIAS